jgi:hypothetical protein
MIELLVAVVLSAIVLGLLGAVSVRQQRFSRDVTTSVERNIEMSQTAALLPIALRSVAPREGDVPPGGARDTSLEFRATIAASVICDTTRNSILLAPIHATPPALTSILSRPSAGDTVWTLAPAPPDAWTPHAISAVVDSSYSCRVGGALVWPFDPPATGVVLRVAGPAVAPAAPARVTRPWRYSLYRGSDGDWYLGAKDWNPATAKFNTIQPVAGPFLSASSGGLSFRYYDSTHALIASGAADPRGIALVEVTVRSDSLLPGRFGHYLSPRGTMVASVGLRNR